MSDNMEALRDIQGLLIQSLLESLRDGKAGPRELQLAMTLLKDNKVFVEGTNVDAMEAMRLAAEKRRASMEERREMVKANAVANAQRSVLRLASGGKE